LRGDRSSRRTPGMRDIASCLRGTPDFISSRPLPKEHLRIRPAKARRPGLSSGNPPRFRSRAGLRRRRPRLSACVSVRPRRECSRRHSPACQPSLSPRGTMRSPANSRRTGSRSAGRRPLTVSSTFTAHVQGLSPASRSALSRRAVSGRPRRRSMRTVVSSTTGAISRCDSRRRDAARGPKPMDRRPSRGPCPRSRRERTRSAPSAARRRARLRRPAR